MSLLGSRIAGGNTAYKRVKSDYYPTPPAATQALLNFLVLPRGTRVWEPACGSGCMVDVMKMNGLDVIGTDIETGTDYLMASLPESDVSWIITNPPFSAADDFIKRSYEHGLPFALLLKAHFWNAKKRYELFYTNRPAYILPLTWRPDFMFKTRGNGSPMMDVSWNVWIPGNHKSAYMPLKKPVTSP